MDKQYDPKNSGILARNERKQQPNHPDFTGQCNVAGVDYWLSGWIKEGKAGGKMEGKKFFSLAFKPKDEPKSDAPAKPVTAKTESLDEDVPF